MNILETERLILSEYENSDAAFIMELLNTPSWLQFIGDRNIKSLDDARNYILNTPVASYRKNGFGLYSVKLKDGNIPIGMCGLIRRESLEDVDIGFALLPQFEGKGYAYEAAAAMLDYAKTHLKLKRIVAITNIDNVSSIRLLEKLGLKFEKNIKFEKEEKELKLFSIDFADNK